MVIISYVPKHVALLASVLIPFSYVAFAEYVKRLFNAKAEKKRKKHTANRDYSTMVEMEIQERQKYREEELKFFLPYSLIYILLIIIIFALLGPYINFNLNEVYFSSKYDNEPTKDKLIKSIQVLMINFILYSGLLIQFLFGNETLYIKTCFCFFMESLYEPALEELLYRGLLFTLLKCAGYNSIISAIFSSLFFSVSHFRHIFDAYFNVNLLPRLFFQLFYTLMFGFYTCYAYNYAGTIFVSILLHGVCNTLQMPRFNYLSDISVSKIQKYTISCTYVFGIVSWVLLIMKYH